MKYGLLDDTMSVAYLDMDSFFYEYGKLYRGYPIDSVIINNLGNSISVPYRLRCAHGKNLRFIDKGLAEPIEASIMLRSDAYKVMHGIVMLIRRYSPGAFIMNIDSVVFKDGQFLDEISHKIREEFSLPFTIASGNSLAESMMICRRLRYEH